MEQVYNDVTYNCNETLSFKDFTNTSLEDFIIPPGTVIYGSCLSQETPDSHIFPEGMNGVTIVRCNLDNVFIPPGNTVIHPISQRRYQVQEDGTDWIIDENNNPIEPLYN